MKTKYHCKFFALFIVLSMSVLISESCKESSTITNGPSTTVEDVERLIKNEIPVGSSLDQVAAFLDAHKIKHSNYKSPPETTSDFDDSKLDGKRDIINGYIIAVIRDVERSDFVRWDIQMYFYFDNKDTLAEYTIRRLGTSL